MGSAVFNNAGFIALIYIYIMQWKRGEPMNNGFNLSLLAMVSFLFYSVNTMSYYGIMTIGLFLGSVQRMS
jgi:hypothetical protein